MPQRANFEVLRQRAYELADSARFSDWREIGGAMEGEGFVVARARLELDPVLRQLLDARCAAARESQAGR
jgi:hypothetical protein